MNESTRPLTDEERADLVAHLSGELPVTDSKAWEARVAGDPMTQTEAHGLRVAWDCLDLLPMPQPRLDFSERTSRLASVDVSSEDRESVNAGWKVRFWRSVPAIAWAAGFLIAMRVGFVVVSKVPDRNRDFLERLPVLTRFDELKAVRDMEFLQALHREKLLDKLEATGDAGGFGGSP